MSSASAPLLHLQGIYKRYGERELLAIDDLRIDTGSAYVLTGMNGSGKSSLLRILAGLETADVRSLCYQGQELSLQPYPAALRQAIVYVHQHPVMFSGTVAENIAYGLRLRHASDLPAQVNAAMAWAGISHLETQNAKTLSGGEKQRVALARAKVLKPRLLLLDEPTSNLDGEAREHVIALIPTLIGNGSSIVIVCHDKDLISLPQVQRLKLRDGRLQMRPL